MNRWEIIRQIAYELWERTGDDQLTNWLKAQACYDKSGFRPKAKGTFMVVDLSEFPQNIIGQPPEQSVNT